MRREPGERIAVRAVMIGGAAFYCSGFGFGHHPDMLHPAVWIAGQNDWRQALFANLFDIRRIDDDDGLPASRRAICALEASGSDPAVNRAFVRAEPLGGFGVRGPTA